MHENRWELIRSFKHDDSYVPLPGGSAWLTSSSYMSCSCQNRPHANSGKLVDVPNQRSEKCINIAILVQVAFVKYRSKNLNTPRQRSAKNADYHKNSLRRKDKVKKILRAKVILLKKTSSTNLAMEQVIQQYQHSTINTNIICQSITNAISGMLFRTKL